MTAIGDYLRELQDQRNHSMRDAAKAIGVSYSRYNEILLGRSRTTGRPTKPSATFLGKAARYYGVPLPLLLERAGLADTYNGPDEEEAHMLRMFRGLSPTGRSLATSLIKALENQERIKPLG